MEKKDLLIDLYSDDRVKVYNALMAKKNWILDQYYLAIDFSPTINDNKKTYPQLYAIIDEGIYFKKCHSDNMNYQKYFDNLSSIDLVKKQNIVLEKSKFYLGLDFKKIDDNVYKLLFPNFYFKGSSKEFLGIDDPFLKAFSSLLIGNNDEATIILSNDQLLNGILPLKIANEIIIKKELLTKEEYETILEISNKTGLKILEM